MSLATALLTPILGDASPWTPRRLFQLGEAGGVYDPSDLTAEKVAWRRNLLTWSEDFTNAAWSKTNVTVTAGVASWNGTLTASTLVENTVNGTHTLIQQVPVKPRVNPTVSFVAKAAGRDWVRVAPFPATPNDFTNNPVAYINLSNGTVGTTTRCTVTVTSRGSGWYFCAVTATQFDVSASTTTTFQIGLASADNTTSYLGDGVSGITFADMQYEAGPATAYQRITDFTSDFLAAFPTHGLYQDAAGTTPVTALGQPVGLVIDSKTGGLANVGAELVTNGDFATNLNGWTLSRTSTASLPVWDAGGMRLVSDGTGFSRADQQLATVAGQSYRVRFSLAMPSSGSGSLTFAVGSTQGASNLLSVPVINATSTFQYVFVATGTASWLRFETGSSNIIGFLVDNVTANLVPGVHAIQPTNSSRPLLDGRVNLLTFSEQFDNAAWTKTNGTITANAAVAPDGTTTADAFIENTANGTHAVVQNITNLNSTTAAYKQEFVVKANGRTRVAIQFASAASGFPAIEGRWDLATGTLTSSGATGTAVLQGTEINALGNGYYRISVTGYTGQSGLHYAQLFMLDASGNIVYTGDGTSGIFVWGADHRLAADAAYPYQRVAAATDYADVGVPRSFLFDGFDDSLYTASNMDLSGTDKVTVLAGVRKLSDAAQGVVVEFTSTVVNPGAFALFAPQGVGSPDNGMRVEAVTAFSANAAPATIVQTGLANRGAPSLVYRVNGTVTASSTSSLGSGNFANSVLNIGRRNNVSTPFNGKAYQLIVRGALTDAATLAQAERYVGAKTGIFL